MKKNFYLITQNSFDYYSIPYLWCSMKTYYEDYGLHPNDWHWHDPNIGEWSEDHLFEHLENNPPDVFGFSVYVWNEERLDKISKKVKNLYPNCLIVYGGPQQNVKHNTDYFKIKTWVDITLPADAYGEIVLKSILDNYPIKDFKEIPYIYYTDSDRNRYISDKTIEKRSFAWPSNIFQRQEKYIIDEIKKQKSLEREIIVIYETSRGCPYKCIYCEWGGGINTKVVKRPYSDILKDIEWLASVGNAEVISIADANFGIMDIDVEIAKFLAECKEKYGFPQYVDYDFAKNNYRNVLDIKDISIGAGLLSFQTISFQTLNEEAKNNIERIDIPFEKQVEGVRYLESKHGYLPVYLEIIMGLPGETLDSYCKQIDKIYYAGLEIGVSKPVPWVLLPEAPAFDPEMRKKFNIQTVKKQIDLNPKLKTGKVFDYRRPFSINLKQDWHNSTTETVVGTYSYTTDDWIKMKRFFSYVVAGHLVGINEYLIPYMDLHHKVLPSAIYHNIVDFSYNLSFKNQKFNDWFQKDSEQSKKWIKDPEEKNPCIDWNEDWTFDIPQHSQIALLILTDAKDFFKEIGNVLSEKYNDKKILDLCMWISNIIIDFSYDFRVERRFESSVEWIEFFNSKGAVLKEGQFEYLIKDCPILNYSNTLDNWILHIENIKEAELRYFLQTASQIKNKLIFDNVELIKD